MNFPKGFLIGAATAAHQVEGNNVHSDYWLQEHLPHTQFAEPSGAAVDHYHRYAEDIALMKAAGLNAYRFSVEWARIEPEEGVYDEAEVAHYKDMIRCCKDNGIEPIVTLLHFSSPAWLIRKGGWEEESTIADFERYTRFIMGEVGSELNYVCTINEANMGLQLAAITKRFTMMAERAQKAAMEAKDAGADKASDMAAQGKAEEGKVQIGMNFQKIMENMKYMAMENAQAFGTPQPQVFVSSRTAEGDRLVMRAHEAARDAIKEMFPNIQVGITLSLHDVQALPGGENFAEKEWDEEFLHYLPYIQNDDFLGVQNYTRTQYGPQGQLPCPEGAELTQMDYEFYPEALEHVIRKVHEVFKGTLIVTENGVATGDDSRRVEFIRRALKGVENCIQDGLPIKGYMHWSLMDNFEWQKGFSMTFGLIGVDRTTMERKPKESLRYLGSYRMNG